MLRYFINNISQSTSSSDVPMYDCRIVNDNYKEVFRETLNEDDKNSFEKILTSDKGAVLNLKHKKLYELAQFKIDHLQDQVVYNGSIWP